MPSAADRCVELRPTAWLSATQNSSVAHLCLAAASFSAKRDAYVRAEEFADIVAEFGIEPCTIYSEGGHNYDYWVSNFPEYLKWLAQGW